jgi:aminodeoxyfutalosine deaminase
VTLEEGTIAAVGPLADLRSRRPELPVEDLGRAIVLPGLVNAHTHLSLSTLSPPRDRGFFPWLEATATASRALDAEGVRAAVRAGARACWESGTVMVGEIATRAEGTAEIAAHGTLEARVFFEFLGVSEERARERFEKATARALAAGESARLRPGLSPHAPYSVWPTLWRETAALARTRNLIWSTHLAEPPGEDRFLCRGDGPVRAYLEALGVWDGSFPVPGTGAVDLLAPALDARALLVHGVHLTADDAERLAATGASLCLCPRSNAVLGLPPPPASLLVARGVPLCLGTDSLASNDDLSVWGEMRALHELAPDIPPPAIVRMATVNGARALGMEDRGGAMRPGLPARLLVVAAPDLGGRDPAEYLVREPVEDRIRHLE